MAKADLTTAEAKEAKERRRSDRKERKEKVKKEAEGSGDVEMEVEVEAEAGPSRKSEKKRKREEKRVDSESQTETAHAEDESERLNDTQTEAEAVEDPDAGLSHKERRKKRQKQEQAKAKSNQTGVDAETDAEATMEGAEGQDTEKETGKGTERKRSAHSVWIGNLRFMTDANALRTWLRTRLNLDPAEEKVKIPRVHMTKGVKKFEHNRGFAYVDLASEELMQATLALSEEPLNGRRLLIKSGTSFEGRPETSTATKSLTKTSAKILASQKRPACETLFFGNLGFQATEAAIRAMIEVHAENWALKTVAGKAKKAKSSFKEEPVADETATPQASESTTTTEETPDASTADAEIKPTRPVRAPRSTAGIRKVRLATFEDAQDKCKGFGFVDFHNVAQATAALINPLNHTLDGRKLVVEYASADAVRRGGAKSKPVNKEQDKSKAKKQDRERSSDHAKADRKARPTSGAALASAQRAAQPSIQTQQGTKVNFEEA